MKGREPMWTYNYSYGYTDEDLMHYGVKGMKWGVRRGHVDKAYAKASKKLVKLDAKIEKRRRQYEKKADKAEDYATRLFAFRSSRVRAARKARNANRKLAAAELKGKKWFDAMDSTFKNTNVSLTAEQTNMGKRYAEAVARRQKAFQYRHHY